MADPANSTPAPVAQTVPPSPLPANASQAWTDLWQSIRFIHPRAPEAFRHVYAAGVDPAGLCLVQLQAPKDHIHVMPRLWFGESQRTPCRIFSPIGEVSQ